MKDIKIKNETIEFGWGTATFKSKNLSKEQKISFLKEAIQKERRGAYLDSLYRAAISLMGCAQVCAPLWDKTGGNYNAAPTKKDVLKMLSGDTPKYCYPSYIQKERRLRGLPQIEW